MSAQPLVKESSMKEKWAWYFYDFGNSAYAAVVLLAVYSAFFQGTVATEGNGTELWGLAISIAMITVALTAPILGIIADFSGKKKQALFVFTAMTIFFTAGLYFVHAGDVFIGMLFFILAEIGYRSGQVFYNSLLPEIATQDEISTVSGNGWAIGSLGGIICLGIVLAMIKTVPAEQTGTMVSLSFLVTAAFFAVSVIPLFLLVKEKKEPQQLPEGENYFSMAFKQLASTLAEFSKMKNSRYQEFRKFIVAFLVYNDGIIAILNFAAIIGAVLFGMKQEQLIIFMIIVQAANVLGSWFYGWLGKKMGFKRSLYQSLWLLIVAVLLINFVPWIEGFYAIGIVAGFAMAGAQSISRAMLGGFAPPGRSAEFYGLFSFAGRTSSFIGPALFGIVVGVSKLFGATEVMAHKFAIGSIALFLLLGIVLLARVNEEAGREVARGVAVSAAD